MQLEFHQLERRLEHLRVHRPERHRRLLASLAASGQQTPIIVVAAEQPAKGRYHRMRKSPIVRGRRTTAVVKAMGAEALNNTPPGDSRWVGGFVRPGVVFKQGANRPVRPFMSFAFAGRGQMTVTL